MSAENSDVSSEDHKIILKSNDGQEFEIPRKLTRQSKLITGMFRDLGLDTSGTSEPIPLPNLNGPTLKKVLEWAEYHKEDALPVEEENKERRTDDIIQWDKDFLEIDQKTLFDIILAANYLDIKALLDTCCKTVANMIKGKTPDEIRKTFNIINDFTKEEEEQIRRENAWCED